MQKVPVFVISLARAEDRRSAIRRHLESYGIEYEIIDAVDGFKLADDDANRLLAPGYALHRGAIGCYLSHVKVYEEIVRREIPVALVLEDDARLDRRICPLLAKGVSSTDFDYCYLDSDPHNDEGPVFYDADSGVLLSEGVVAYELSAGPQTLHACLITLEGARKRLGAAYPIAKPIDIYGHLPFAPRFRAVVQPKLAWVGEESLMSFTSVRAVGSDEIRLRFLRRYPAFFQIRDFLLLRAFRKGLQIPNLIDQGRLTAGRRWRPLPGGRDVLFKG